MSSKSIIVWTALFVIILAGCSRDRTYITLPASPSSVPTTPTTPVVVTNKIEFRVSGTATSVRVRYSTPLDGLSQTVTSLPFFASFNTTQSSHFLSLDVTPLTFPLVGQPFLSAQILVDGNLFREASSFDLTTSLLSVSGNWRR